MSHDAWGDGQDTGRVDPEQGSYPQLGDFPVLPSTSGHPAKERRGPIECVVEDRSERVTEARIGHQLGVRQVADSGPQQVDPGERIRLARQQQDRAVDGRPVGDPGGGPLRGSGRMERVAEQDERGIRGTGFGRGEAGDPAAVLVTTDEIGRAHV